MSVTEHPRGLRWRTQLHRVAAAVATPLVPADYLDLLMPLAGQALRGRIEAIQPETADAVSLLIRPSRGWPAHEAGQYIRIGIDVDGVRLWRAYSVTSPPGQGDRISVTVKAMTDGVVSHYLVHQAKPGTIVQLEAPTGDFVLGARPPRAPLFITAGSGITPVMGMLRSRLDELVDPVHLHVAPTAADAIFGTELRQLSELGRLRFIEHHDAHQGLLDAAALARHVPDFAARETWACGPVGLLDMLEELYAGAGAAERLHTERFRASIVATGEGGSVTFTRQGMTVDAVGATPLLSAGEAAGALMPSGCRMGICYGCVVPLAEGAVRDLRTGELTTAAPGDHVQIQTCINAAAGACRIDL